MADFLGRKAALTYRIVEFEPGKAVTLRGENATVVSLDRITFEPSDGGTRVTYDADLALKGPLRIADPLLGLAFDRVGDRALEGLRETLGSRAPARLPPLSGRSLDGRHHNLPGDLRAQHTFIVAAFRREQQALVDEWLPWLVDLEQRRPDVAVYELPVLSSAYSPARWFIDGGMARGVGTDAARARTITVYTDVGEGRARTRTARHRHDRRPARRPLGPHPRPRTRRLRRREGDAAHRGARALERRRLNGAARSSALSRDDLRQPTDSRPAGRLHNAPVAPELRGP